MLTLLLAQAITYTVALFPVGADPALTAPVAILATVPDTALQCPAVSPADGTTLRLTGTWYDTITASGKSCETPPIPTTGIPVCTALPCPVYQIFIQATATGDGITTVGATVGPWSAPATPLLTAILLPDPARPECVGPFGNRSVSISPTGIRRTTGKPNSQSAQNFQLASPNSPITTVAYRIDGIVAAALSGEDLTDTAGMWFAMPASGTHTTSLAATNAYGCTREVSAGALVVP